MNSVTDKYVEEARAYVRWPPSFQETIFSPCLARENKGYRIADSSASD